jgi:hypothetical protein
VDLGLAAAIAIVSAAVAVASFLVNGRHTWKREDREQQIRADAEVDRTIELLKEQNVLLSAQNETLVATHNELACQGERREQEWHKREQEWLREKKALEVRISEVERDYRNLVLTVTTMGFCANAATCATYNPGDRRARLAGPPGDTPTEEAL